MTDLHVHTAYCDGKNTPREMIEAAVAKGMKCIGFSGHSHTSFDESYCMSEEKTLMYRDEILRLKEEYKGVIKVLCGIERDFYSDDTFSYDYVIGSVHYINVHGEYIPIDMNADVLRDAADRYFGGDMYSLAEVYFDTVSGVVEKTGADIIGHFDLVSKFNETDHLFDEKNERYIAAWKKAADKLLSYGKIFEVNTGGISRGYKTVSYPSSEMINYISNRNGTLMLTGDSHAVDTLCFGFDAFSECENLSADGFDVYFT